MSGHLASVLAFLVASAAGLASAQPRAPSELRVEGTALARGVTVRLDCGRDGQHLRCEVGQRFELSAGGLGLVLTQLGPRDADAALRIRLALSSYVLGVITDFDYFPSTGTWTAGVAARVGI